MDPNSLEGDLEIALLICCNLIIEFEYLRTWIVRMVVQYDHLHCFIDRVIFQT